MKSSIPVPDGLTQTEAADRLKRWGGNQLRPHKPISLVKLFFKQFANYFILVLLFAAGLAYGVSFMPGQSERRLTAYFILIIILLSVLLSFFEEYRSQRELEALDTLLVFRTSVLREGLRREDRRRAGRAWGRDGAVPRTKSARRWTPD